MKETAAPSKIETAFLSLRRLTREFTAEPLRRAGKRVLTSWESIPWDQLGSRDLRERFPSWQLLPQRPPRLHPPLGLQVPPKEEERLRFFSLNVAHGRRHSPIKPYLRHREARRNIAAVAQAVRELTPDVVALQEADGPSPWSGNLDHVATLMELTDLVDHYRGNHNRVGIGRFRMTAGTALLARQPLLDPVSHRFRLNWRDTKGFVVATVAVPEWDDMLVDVVSVHLDFLNPVVRRKQILHMFHRLIARRRPLVVLGDLNCCFEREPRSMQLLVETLGLRAYQPEEPAPTYPTKRPRRRLDWILISEELEYGGYHTVQVPLSDHLVLVADVHPR